MRNTEERVLAVKLRVEEIERHNRLRRRRVLVAGSFAASLLIIVGLSLAVSRVFDAMPDFMVAAAGAFGSLFDENRFAGYIVIGLLAFCLGVCTTILAHKVKKLNREE